MFSCEIRKSFKNTFFYRTPPVTGSGKSILFATIVVLFIDRFTQVPFPIDNVALEQMNFIVSFFLRFHKDLFREKVFGILFRVMRGVTRYGIVLKSISK